MGWVKLDDTFSEHHKVEQAGDLAAWLYVCGLLYCSRALTDGFIPESRVQRLCSVRAPLALAQRLVDVRLWERVEGGFRVHDYTEHQRSAAQVKRERQANARRQSRHRDTVSNGESNAVTAANVTGAREEEIREEPPLAPPRGNGEATERLEALKVELRKAVEDDLTFQRYLAPLEADGFDGTLWLRAPVDAPWVRRRFSALMAQLAQCPVQVAESEKEREERQRQEAKAERQARRSA